MYWITWNGNDESETLTVLVLQLAEGYTKM
jgi:hypothetical protein